MSTNSDGIFFYGLCWDEEGGLEGVLSSQREERDEEACDDEADDGSEDFEDRLSRLLGGPSILGCGKHLGDAPRRAAFTAYFDARDTFLHAQLVPAVRDVLHCSYNDPMFGLAIETTYRHTRRGDPERIEDFAVPNGSAAVLRKVCVALGINFDKAVADGRLGWWLTSVYG